MSADYAFALDGQANAGVASAIRERLRAEVVWLERLIDFVGTALGLLIYPLFVSAFLSAGIYMARFHLGDTIDNHLINSRFERIDARRLAQGQPTLLPLYSIERRKVRSVN